SPALVRVVSLHCLDPQALPAFPTRRSSDLSDESTLLAQWLKDNGVTEVEVAGIATDHCVLATAKDALREGFTVSVIADLCAPVDKTRGENALTELEEAGASIIR